MGNSSPRERAPRGMDGDRRCRRSERNALAFLRARRLRHIDGFAVDLGELDAQQSPLDADARLPLPAALLEGEHFGIDFGDPEADDHGLVGRDIVFQALDDRLTVSTADTAVELGVADVTVAAAEGSHGAGQELLALLRLHSANTIEIADAFDVQVEERRRAACLG